MTDRVRIRTVDELREAVCRVFDDALRQAVTDIVTSSAPDLDQFDLDAALAELFADVHQLRDAAIAQILADVRALATPTIH